jgi:hypothetical protein
MEPDCLHGLCTLIDGMTCARSSPQIHSQAIEVAIKLLDGIIHRNIQPDRIQRGVILPFNSKRLKRRGQKKEASNDMKAERADSDYHMSKGYPVNECLGCDLVLLWIFVLEKPSAEVKS